MRTKKTPATELDKISKQISAAQEWLQTLVARKAAIVAKARAEAEALLKQVGE
jgi:hypothetical protein